MSSSPILLTLFRSLKEALFCAVIFLVIVFLVIVAPITAYAGEVKILDEHGLARAIKVIKGSTAIVTVELSSASSSTEIPSLFRNDGISKDVLGKRVSEKSLLFSGVTEGSWALRGLSGEKIKSVRIAE